MSESTEGEYLGRRHLGNRGHHAVERCRTPGRAPAPHVGFISRRDGFWRVATFLVDQPKLWLRSPKTRLPFPCADLKYRKDRYLNVKQGEVNLAVKRYGLPQVQSRRFRVCDYLLRRISADVVVPLCFPLRSSRFIFEHLSFDFFHFLGPPRVALPSVARTVTRPLLLGRPSASRTLLRRLVFNHSRRTQLESTAAGWREL